MIEYLFLPGGYLSLWGVALLLVWLSTLRLVNLVHIRLAEADLVRAPRRVYAPMKVSRELTIAFSALCSGAAGLLAFASAATRALPLPTWIQPLALPPAAELLRIVFAMVVLAFFVAQVAEHPRFKLKWIAAWTVFALVLTWIS